MARTLVWFLVVLYAATVFARSPPRRRPPPPPKPSKDTYLIMAPNEITRGATYRMTVDILKGKSVHVTALLQEHTYNHTSHKYDSVTKQQTSGTFTQGETGVLQMEISDTFNCRGPCKLVIQGRGDEVFERTTNLHVKSNLLSKFIQTDKAIYKPGQRVRYRAFAVYQDLRVYKGTFSIEITDPSHNKISVQNEVKGDAGVVEGFLNLSDQPPFGDWTIRIKVEEVSESVSQTFTVDQYELPRFEVTVDLAPYAMLRETSVSGTVKAKYTYGKPVKGMVDLHVGPNQGPDNCGKMPKSVNIGFEIDGEGKFTVPLSSIRRVMGVNSGTTVRFTAFVTETATGVTLNGSNTIKFHTEDFAIKFQTNTPGVFKPGLPYTAYVEVKAPDGMPPPERSTNNITLYPYAQYTVTVPEQDKYGQGQFTGTYALPKMVVPLTANGIVPINLEIPNNATSINMRAYFGRYNTNKDVGKTFSQSGNYMQLTLLHSDLKSGDVATFKIQATEALTKVRYEIISRGTITKLGLLEGALRKTFTFDLDLTADMGPVANLLTYYVRQGGEVVADSIAFNVDDVFKNKVTVDFSKQKAEPNTAIELKVSADPMSKVYLLAVDQSVLLLKSGNDIDTSKVERGISSQKQMDSEFALSHSAVNVAEVLSKAGLLFITDATLRQRQPRPNRRYGGRQYSSHDISLQSFMPGPAGMSSELGRAPTPLLKAGNQPLKEVKRVRNLFPEAWLWTDVLTDGDGSTIVNTTVPDTITTWVASAFATNDKTGLGVTATKANMTVFRSFFVSLTYPHTVKRNEQAVIQATVFNYLSMDVQVSVTLKDSPGFHHIVMSGDKERTVETAQPQRVMIRSDDHGVVYFPIVAKDVGVFDIEVAAQTALAADAVRRPINIQPEGAPASYNHPIYIDGDSVSYNERHAFTFPDSVVDGSQKITVGVSGDLIGPSFDNVESLLSIPVGCGEQNMVRFAPTLYMARYLKATGQLTDSIKRDVVDKLAMGYQRQLTYRRTDASFSAFGNHDESGSTWLTAYVVRTLNEARDFIYVDPQVLISSVDWLVNRQRRDGAFVEMGRVIDPNTQGKSTGPALTAYVLLAIKQNSDFVSEKKCKESQKNCQRTWRWNNATKNATENLEKVLDSIQDPFSLSVVAYALGEVRSRKASRAYRRLRGMATTQGGLSFWKGTSDSNSSPAPSYHSLWSPPVVQSRPINILITSYALLAYVGRGQTRTALPIVRWLVMQRNSLGGFASTQDTTVALQALSAFAGRTYKPNTKLSVNFEMEGGQSLSFDVDQSNMLNYQKKEFQQMPSSANQRYNVDLNAIGHGLAIAEISYEFHRLEVPESDAFEVSTVLLDDNLDHFNLMICTKWLKSHKTGMVVQEIEVPSGFEPDMTSIGNVAGMKRSERKGNMAVVYFEEIVKTSTCYSLIMSRQSKVAKAEKSFVHTFNYYSPEDTSTEFYHPRKLRKSTICDVCPRCCR